MSTPCFGLLYCDFLTDDKLIKRGLESNLQGLLSLKENLKWWGELDRGELDTGWMAGMGQELHEAFDRHGVNTVLM